VKKLTNETCYICGAAKVSDEHFPPKAFFPSDRRLRRKLKTVPSCKAHNNDKSEDDVYLLAHISINAAAGDNLAKKVFLRSIMPNLKSRRFRAAIAKGARVQPDGAVAYPVDVARFDSFFNHLACAVYFDRYGEPLDTNLHSIAHIYLDLVSNDPTEQRRIEFIAASVAIFTSEFSSMITEFEAEKQKAVIYENKIMDPGGVLASITIVHTFYGVFNVVTLLTKKGIIGRR
jgi:hypothetical protein